MTTNKLKNMENGDPENGQIENPDQMLKQSLALACPGKNPEELHSLMNLSQYETAEPQK